jgi:hypothetical protein
MANSFFNHERHAYNDPAADENALHADYIAWRIQTGDCS